MDRSEEIAQHYLVFQGFRRIDYEPDGNVPPDFLADRRVAVEVRRLNQQVEVNGQARGLEEVAEPLQDSLRSLLGSLGPTVTGETWRVEFRFTRPIPKWKRLRRILREHLKAFRDSQEHKPTAIHPCDNLELRISRVGNPGQHFFRLSSVIDQDAGGWTLEELHRSLEICLPEKTAKISRFRHKYPEWWLILIGPDWLWFGRL